MVWPQDSHMESLVAGKKNDRSPGWMQRPQPEQAPGWATGVQVGAEDILGGMLVLLLKRIDFGGSVSVDSYTVAGFCYLSSG